MKIWHQKGLIVTYLAIYIVVRINEIHIYTHISDNTDSFLSEDLNKITIIETKIYIIKMNLHRFRNIFRIYFSAAYQLRILAYYRQEIKTL